MKKLQPMLKATSILLSAVIISALTFGTSLAATFKAGENYSLRATENITDNFYSAGSNLSLDGGMQKDVFVAGSNVNITSGVREDLFAAGATLNLLGNVGGDVRAAGATVLLNAPVAGEAMLAGATVTFGSKATTKELYIGGGEVVLSGVVNGNALVSAQKLTINGTVNGALRVYADKIVLGSTARISGVMEYDSRNEVVIEEGAVVTGGVKFNQVDQTRGEGVKDAFIVAMLLKALFMLVAAVILYLIFKGGVKRGVALNMLSFWKDLLIGFMILVLMPVAGVLLMLTVFGIPFAVLLFFIYVAMIILGMFHAMYLSAGFIGKVLRVRTSYVNIWTVLAGGFLLQLVGMIPVVGWIIAFGMFLAAFGFLFKSFYHAIVLRLR